MPYLIFTDEANAGIRRCMAYLHVRSLTAEKKAQIAIRRQINKLKRSPYIGRPYDPPGGTPDRSLRELVIRFGGKGSYLALYQYRPEQDEIRIIAFKHGQEARY